MKTEVMMRRFWISLRTAAVIAASPTLALSHLHRDRSVTRRKGRATSTAAQLRGEGRFVISHVAEKR